MPHRRLLIVAAMIGLFLMETAGCARRQSDLRYQSGQQPKEGFFAPAPDCELCRSPTGDGVSHERFDPRLDAAFQRLHQAKSKLPGQPQSATRRETPPPAARVASPFAKPSPPHAGSMR